MPTYPVSDHFDGERFFNTYAQARPLKEVVKWMRTRQRTAWPAQVVDAPQLEPPRSVQHGSAAVTFIGHSTFLIRTASTVIITDPVFTSHAGPFGRTGPRRVRPPGIAASALPSVDLVLVSHNHYDHLQPASLRLFADSASFVAPLGVGQFLPPEGGSYGIGNGSYEIGNGSHEIGNGSPVASAFRRKELDWWEKTTIGAAEVTSVPAQHFAARTPWDRNRTLWCGFVVRVDGVTIYFAGDSGYSPQFREIGERCPGIDVALMPIGAYEPRWFMQPVHMNPDEAVRAHLDVKARVSISMHFGTFQLTDEGIDEPVRALARARLDHGVGADAFRVLGVGATFVTPLRQKSASPT